MRDHEEPLDPPSLESPQTAYYQALDQANRALSRIPADRNCATEAALSVFALSLRLTPSLAELPSRDCESGCAACCHFEVGLREPEAVRLANAIREHPNRTKLLESIRRALETDRPPLSPCPLLNEAAECSVYDDRPLPCRGWSATSSALCRAHLSDPSIEPAPLPTAFALHLGLGDALDEWSARANLAPGPKRLSVRLAEHLGL